MPKKKGDGELEPHLHSDKRLEFLFHLFDSACAKCQTEDGEVVNCPFQGLCEDTFDILVSWAVRDWKRRIRIWELREQGITIPDIAKEVNLGDRKVKKILRALDKMTDPW